MPLALQTAAGASFVINWSTWIARDRAVLTFVRRNGQVILIHKKRGLGAGKINAPGGRIEAGETPEAAAIRETREEICVTPTGLRPAGRLFFAFVDGYGIDGHVFVADGADGEMAETDEAAPFWCPEGEIPYARMWADDALWIPLMLRGISFQAWFVFDGDRMLWKEVRQVAEPYASSNSPS